MKAYHQQGQNDIAWKNRKWYRIYPLCTLRGLSCKWQRCRGKLTLLKYKFHPFVFCGKHGIKAVCLDLGPGPWPLNAPSGTDGGVLLASQIQFMKHYATILSFWVSLSKCGCDMHLDMDKKAISVLSYIRYKLFFFPSQHLKPVFLQKCWDMHFNHPPYFSVRNETNMLWKRQNKADSSYVQIPRRKVFVSNRTNRRIKHDTYFNSAWYRLPKMSQWNERKYITARQVQVYINIFTHQYAQTHSQNSG